MNQPRPQQQPARSPAPHSPAPSREPELTPEQVLTVSVDTVQARLSTAKSVAVQVFGAEVKEETVISVYDRLNDQIAELLGAEEPDEEEE